MFRPVRTRLLDELARSDSGQPKVVSLVAPIGYGKTVLMSELYAHSCRAGEQCFWIGLDDSSVSVERVLSALENALARPESDVHPTQALFRGGETPEGRRDELIEVIARLPAPVIIFIDNLNSCTDEALAPLLDALIFRTPASVRLVWSSTTDPGINLARAKLEGLMRDVGFAELSLDAEEARELLGVDLEGKIGSCGVAAIVQQTEGWPAAVRMAQIVLSGSAHPRTALESFSGSDEDVAGLLNRQVLQGFDERLRTFLFCLAQLRTFSADLCRYAIGDKNAERYLDLLLRRNVFIIPLDRNRKHYRLHGLFRQYLLGEAGRAIEAERKRCVLQRAAEWCEREGDWRDAIDYALASERLDVAGRILECTATVFVRDRGDVQQYISWIDRLQAGGAYIGWEAHFWYVWALIFRRRYELARAQHERLAERLRCPEQGEASPPGDLTQRTDHLRMCIDLFTDRPFDTLQRAERWLAERNSGDPFNIGAVSGLKAFCLAGFFRFAEARRAMRVAEPILRQAGSDYFLGWVTLGHAVLSMFAGDYAHAYRELQAGLVRTRATLGDDTKLGDVMALLAAKCAVEMGCDEEARDWLRLGLRSVYTQEAADSIECTACGFDAAIKLWDGGSEAPIAVTTLQEIAGRYPPRLSLMVSCYLVQRLLHLGRVKEALAEASRIGLVRSDGQISVADSGEPMLPRYREIRMAAAIDLMLAGKHYKEVGALIAAEMDAAQADGRISRMVELGLAKATLAMHRGHAAAAAKELARAVSHATQGHVMRPFRDQAGVVAALINDTKLSSWVFTLPEERQFFAKICDGLPISNRFLQQRSEIRGNASPVVLTRREVELLSLIDIGLSNKQMIDHTDIAVGTIKWHLKNLYKKLGVTNRSAALARARALNFLSK